MDLASRLAQIPIEPQRPGMLTVPSAEPLPSRYRIRVKAGADTVEGQEACRWGDAQQTPRRQSQALTADDVRLDDDRPVTPRRGTEHRP